MLRRAAFSPNIKERADCSAALFTADGELLVQAEHIPVHLGSMPASVAAAIEAFGATALAPGRPGRPQRPLRRRHPPQRPHPGGAVLPRRPPGRMGRQPGPPRRRGRDGAGLDPGRRHRDLPGGPAHPAGAAHRRGRGDPVRQLPHARRAPGRPRRPAGRQRGRGRAAGRPRRHRRPLRRGHRLRRAAHAGRPGRGPRRAVDVRRRDRLVRPVARAATPGPDRGHPDRRRARRPPSTSPAPTASGPAT